MRRRIFLQVTGATALLPATVPGAPPPQDPQHGTHAGAARPAAGAATADAGYRFFTAPEAAFIEAAVDRLIPPDEIGPGAVQAGVPTYIDRQLDGAWGAGERLYRSGPWQAGTPSQGYQLQYTPAQLFRTALRGIVEDLQRTGSAAFELLPGGQQDAYLTMLQTTQRDLAGVPSGTFFTSLLSMTAWAARPCTGTASRSASWTANCARARTTCSATARSSCRPACCCRTGV